MNDFLNEFNFEKIGRLLLYDPAQPLLFNTGLFFMLFICFMVIYEALRSRQSVKMIITILFSLYFLL